MTDPSCHSCVFACWDPGLWLRSLGSGLPARPLCANHPDSPGRQQETPPGALCRNYRARPAEPDLADGSVKRIPVAGGYYAYVDAADYEWLSKYRWCPYGGKYAARHHQGKWIFMHREIMQAPPGMVCDHKSGNGTDNTRPNLRDCTRQQNLRNRRERMGCASRFKGVYPDKKRGLVYGMIIFEGKRIRLGCFKDEADAARAYDRKALECFGEFARLNFPDEWPPERRQALYAQYPHGPNGPTAEKQDGKAANRNPVTVPRMKSLL
jgi:hypothetical protein